MTTREAHQPTEAEITPERQRLIDLKATMPMRDDLTCAMFAAWLGVSVDKLPGEFKQFDNPATMIAWRRVADAARAALSTPVTEPQAEYVDGYCKGIDDAVRRYDAMSGPDTWDYFYTAKQSMLALKDFSARPDSYPLCEDEGCPHHGTEHICNSYAPQPSADTRSIPVETMQSWCDDFDAISWHAAVSAGSVENLIDQIRIIIGGTK